MIDAGDLQLAAVERASSLAVARARREREVAAARLAVDRETVQGAQRVAALSATAFREGAYPLSSVLEAQRAARDALRQYLEDLVASRSADAALRLALSAGGALP